MMIRKFTEKQIRWSLILSKYDFIIVYRPNEYSSVPDILSRHPQNMPIDNDDNRIQYQFVQFVKPDIYETDIIPDTICMSLAIADTDDLDHDNTDNENEEDSQIELEIL